MAATRSLAKNIFAFAIAIWMTIAVILGFGFNNAHAMQGHTSKTSKYDQSQRPLSDEEALALLNAEASELEARNAEQKARNAEQEAHNEKIKKRIAEKQQKIIELDARIIELDRQQAIRDRVQSCRSKTQGAIVVFQESNTPEETKSYAVPLYKRFIEFRDSLIIQNKDGTTTYRDSSTFSCPMEP